MSRTIYRSFKIRLYPTKQQEELMWKHINHCRFIWNYMLAMQFDNYQNGNKLVSYSKMCKELTKIKQENCGFLYEVSNFSLQTICRDLEFAYQQYFRKIAEKPKFKKKNKSTPRFPIRENRFYFISNKILHIEKIGRIKYKSNIKQTISFGFDTKFVNPKISFVCNKWILSFGMEFNIENQDIKHNDIKVGIDLGIKEQAVVYSSDDNFIVFHNINKSKSVRKLKQRIKTLQHSISRKYEYSKKRNRGRYVKTKNIIKQEKLLRSLYNKLSNIRHNYLHQITHQIIKLNPSVVIMEDLNVQNMLKNKYLAQYIHEQNFYTFRKIMEYKCALNNIQFVLVDRYFPSSKMCNKCGNIKSNLQLSDRTYVCECCGNVVDRDLNAAINLCRYDFHFEENQS